MEIKTKKIVLKRLFLRKLPYIYRWKKDQIFISNLIKKRIFLNRSDQNLLLEYFNVKNKHWSENSGEYSFDIWVLFTNPESCKIFDKKLIDEARIKIIPYMTKWDIGELERNVKEYAKLNQNFNELYLKRISENTYYQRNYIYQTKYEKMKEKIRVRLYKNKALRYLINKYIYKYDIKY
jgi:hypothetical protein